MMHPDDAAWVAFYLGGNAESWPVPEIGAVMTALELKHGRSRARDMGLAFLALELKELLAEVARLTPISPPLVDAEG